MASTQINALFIGVLVVLAIAVVVYFIVPLFSETSFGDGIERVSTKPKIIEKKTVLVEPASIFPSLEEVKVKIPVAKHEEAVVEQVRVPVVVAEKVVCIECAEKAARGDIKGCEGIQDVGARDACLLMAGSRDCKVMKSEIGRQVCGVIVQ